MNTLSIFALVVAVTVASVSSNRRLNFIDFSNFQGGGLLDEINGVDPVLGQFQGNQFSLYGDSVASITTALSPSQTSDDGFSFGSLVSNVAASNDDDEDATIEGFNVFNTNSNPDFSLTQLISDQTASSNGPGESSIDFNAEGGSSFGNSVAGFSIQGSDRAESDTNAVSRIVSSGIGLTLPGFSLSNATICAGANCP